MWTKEPYHAVENVTRYVASGREIHVFNVYNGRVYTDNYYDLSKTGP